jgi:heme/copper-type cytochrome/quinol oxidase subunit 3
MFFGGLFSAFVFLRAASAEWPRDALEHALPVINTAVLVMAGVAAAVARLHLGRRGSGPISRGDERAFLLLWGSSLALGLVFLFVKSAEWGILLGMGRLPKTHNLFALYFTMTGLHALHLIGGLLVNGWLMLGAAMRRGDPDRYRERIAGALLYGSFVELLWVAIMLAFFVF